MVTQVINLCNIEDNPEGLNLAAKTLREGGLVAIPTETVYGLAANALDNEAVKKIFIAKGRPQDNPLIVHITELPQLYALASEVPDSAIKLAKAFWPGPLTMILKKSAIIPPAVSAGLETVGVRMPSNKTARAIINAAGVPLAAPSANLSGSPSPTTAQHCLSDLNGRVPIIVDGGACEVGLESTVISLAFDKPRLLRPGAVTKEQLSAVLSQDVILDDAVLGEFKGEKASSPGMKYKHYSPKARVTILKGDTKAYVDYVNHNSDNETFAMCFDEDGPLLKIKKIEIGSVNDTTKQAKELFAALRKFDKLGAKRVFAHCPTKNGIGLAVYNRLLRSAAFDVIELD